MIAGAWEILTQWVVPVVFVITAVVFFHELGHYSVARLFRVRVQTFSLGFGPEIIGRTDKHGTRWRLSWLPIGGYVQFFGDADAASRPDTEAAESMTAEERKVSLQHKPLYQRALVVAAGPFANFILAIVIFTLTLTFVGKLVIPPVVGSVAPGSPAQHAGIKAGDMIRDIDGTTIRDFNDIAQVVMVSAGQDLAVTLQRGQKQVVVHLTPMNTSRKVLGSEETVPILGVGSLRITPTYVRLGLGEALGESVRQTWGVIAGTFKGLKQLILGRTDTRQLHGTVSIVVMTKNIAQFGFLALVQLVALLSVSIGLINLFPIPVLDGGHLLYYGCEAVLGRPLGERAQEVGFRFGLALVLGLMIFSFWNDLAHHLNLF